MIAIITHFILWYTPRIYAKYGAFTLFCSILFLSTVVDFILYLTKFNRSKFFALFPPSEGNKLSYNQIISQYVGFKKFLKNSLEFVLEYRATQRLNFTIFILFGLLLLVFIHPIFNGFLLVYLSVFSLLLGPGIWYNDIPQRIYAASKPHLINIYSHSEAYLSKYISPKSTAVTDVVEPAPTPVDRTVPLRNLNRQTSIGNMRTPENHSPRQRPSSVIYPAVPGLNRQNSFGPRPSSGIYSPNAPPPQSSVGNGSPAPYPYPYPPVSPNYNQIPPYTNQAYPPQPPVENIPSDDVDFFGNSIRKRNH